MGKRKTKKSTTILVVKKTEKKTIKDVPKPLAFPKIKNPVELEKITKEALEPDGHFEGIYWVWPNGQRTHVRFIDLAIRQMRPLPVGFYEEAEKETYLTNVKNMLRKAKQLKLPATVNRI